MDREQQSALVLVVEDNPAMNMAICDILELHGYRVLSAANGKVALEMLQETRPDVVLCDIMMPEMDGYTLLRHARSDERLRTVPFIFLTARSSPEDKREAKTIGIEDYLVKPVEPEDLILAIENALRRSRDVTAEAQRQMANLRSQIINTLQHEFRTPLTFVLGYAEFLAEVAGSQVDVSTLQASIEAILEGGQRLQSLIENFLLLADLQGRDRLPEPVEPLNAHLLLKTVAGELEPQAQEAGLSLIIAPENPEVDVEGYRIYLHDALHRLVTNAIQYSRPDSQKVVLSVVVSDRYVGLQVQDWGVGIPAAQLAHMRQPFEQINRNERTTPGAGLSLALVQHVARLHGGSLSIDSVEGQGSTFTLWLPRALD